MEPWRLIAAALLAVAGLVLVLLTMAKARDRTGSTHGSVALAGVVAFTVLAVLCVLVLTVLPAVLAWGAAGAVVLTVSVMLLAS